MIRSVNVGAPTPTTTRGQATTGIDKHEVGFIDVRDPGPKRGGLGSGVVGDAVVNRRHHGGHEQAVYAFAREELDWWAGQLGRELRDGLFGENLTTQGLDVDASVIGSTWRVGGAVLRVTGPRVPCSTFAAQMGERRWVKRFTERGRTGAYLAVVEPGRIRAGDAVDVVDVPAHGFTAPQAFRAWMGDRDLGRAILDAGAGSEAFRAELATRVACSS